MSKFNQRMIRNLTSEQRRNLVDSLASFVIRQEERRKREQALRKIK